MCGDFNARCGMLGMESEGLPNKKVIDEVKNNQGEMFVDFLRSVNMGVVNGRKGKDTFTCVSGKGCSVVDYCIVGAESFDLIDNFRVVTMLECIDEMQCKREVIRVPDHSLVQWEVMVGSMEVKVEEEGQQVGKMRKIVPENYLQKEVEKSEIEALTSKVMQAGASQKEIDDIYEELVEVMKRGLVEVSRKKGERRQPWFSREMAKLRKVFHDSEKEWLNCDSKETRREKRREYVEKRRSIRRQ